MLLNIEDVLWAVFWRHVRRLYHSGSCVALVDDVSLDRLAPTAVLDWICHIAGYVILLHV
jgi:hypothetical protein